MMSLRKTVAVSPEATLGRMEATIPSASARSAADAVGPERMTISMALPATTASRILVFAGPGATFALSIERGRVESGAAGPWVTTSRARIVTETKPDGRFGFAGKGPGLGET